MLTIGAASRLSGVNIETIRYYEKRGLVNEPDRTASGRRLYIDEMIAELRLVRRCGVMGFSMDDIEDILASARSGGKECRMISDVGRRHLKAVREKIKSLQELEAGLCELLGQCREDDPPDLGEHCSCPLLDVLLRDPLT